MPPVTRFVCLANSWKRGERCIAGIDMQTGEWIRPVSDLPYGAIPQVMRRIDCREPELLDVLEIPLATTGDNFGFECENRTVLPGKWQRIGRVAGEDMVKYCQDDEFILHNQERYVTVPFLQSLPEQERKTLQLVKAVEFSVRFTGKRFMGSVISDRGQSLTATITDPVFAYCLDLGIPPKVPCLVTVSLSMPWRPEKWEEDDPCWKLIAGVIKL